MSHDAGPGEPVSIAILAGGQSRRMGRNKALLRIGSRTLIEVVAERVRQISTDLFVVATDTAPYERLGFRVVPDRRDGCGSLGGIYTALSVARFERCLVLACDMPFLNRALLQYMCRLPCNYDVLVPVRRGDQQSAERAATYETLHAIYTRAILDVIELRIEAGALKISDLLADVRTEEIDATVIRRFDPTFRSFFNANTPEDFARVECSIDSRNDRPEMCSEN